MVHFWRESVRFLFKKNLTFSLKVDHLQFITYNKYNPYYSSIKIANH